MCTCNSGFVANKTLTACEVGNGSPVSPPPPTNVKPDKDLQEPSVCNPINPATGLKYQIEVDYRSPTGLEFKRTYNSLGTDKAALPGSFGTSGWRLDWQRSIQGSSSDMISQMRVRSALGGISSTYGGVVYRDVEAGKIYTAPASSAPIVFANVIRGGGKVYTFKLVNGVWKSDADINDRLTAQLNAAGGIAAWIYTTEDMEVERYNPTGQLLSVTERTGQTTTLTYSNGTAGNNGGYVLDATGAPTTTILPAGRLIRITDAYQRSLNLGYDAASRIVKMTDPAGGAYKYAYDTNNNLVSVAYPDSKARQYLYENATYPHALTGVTDENGSRFATYAYNSSGRAILTEHAGGAERAALTYNSSSTIITDAIGTARTQTYQVVQGVLKIGGTNQPGGSGCGASASSMTYDANGNIASSTDFNGNLTTYTYDLTRNLETSRTEGLTTAGAKTPATRTINTVWDATYRKPVSITEQDTSGASTVTLRTTSFSYDAKGNLLTNTITDGQTPTSTRTYAYTYDASGHRLSADGPRTDIADITSYAYDAKGNLVTVTNALNHVTTLGSYDAHGRPGSITDPNGLVTSLTYDARGRLTSRSGGTETTRYTYDAAGQLITVAAPTGAAYTYTYDAAHRLTGIADSLGNRISYTLDAMGNRTKEEIFDNADNIVQTHSRAFDALNRLYQDIGAVNQATTYAYDANGNLTSSTDALNRHATNSYDALNRLVSSTDPANGITRYGYDALDQLVNVTDPKSLVTQYQRDGLGNLNQQTSPDTGTTANTYDEAGNLTTRTDAKGQVATYSYDALNRLTGISYSGGASPAQTVTYQYDQGSNAIGHLTGITDATGTTSFSYDQHGRLTGETKLTQGVSYATGYSYDAQGRMDGITYPSGRTVNYSFDGMGRINQIATTFKGKTTILASNIAYEPFGGVHSFTYGDGQTTPVQTYTRQRDQDGRIASYTLKGNAMSIGYDAASQISFISDPQDLVNVASYNYDSMSRLTGFTLGTLNQNFGYDADGNRISQTVGSTIRNYSYAPGSNRLAGIQTGSGMQTVTHDAIGATTSDLTRQYAYDNRGRLIQATTAQGIINYEVNALGLRVRKQVPYANTDTLYHYDTQGHLIGENPLGDSRFTREYIYLGDQPVAVIQ